MLSCHKTFEHAGRIFARLALVALVMVQGWGINGLVVTHFSHARAIFDVLVALDALNAALLGICVWLAYAAIHWIKRHRKKEVEVDFEFKAWKLTSAVTTPEWMIFFPFFCYTFYVVSLFVRVVLIFVEDFDDILEEKSTKEFRETLQIRLGLTALIFFFFSLCHQNAHPNHVRKHLMDNLAGMVTLDVLDTVEFLELLFDDVRETPQEYLVCVMVFSCVALFVPCIAILDLSKSNFGARPSDRRLHALFLSMNLAFVNVPYLVVRVLTKLHHRHHHVVSVMIVKNVIVIMAVARELFHLYVQIVKERGVGVAKGKVEGEEVVGVGRKVDGSMVDRRVGVAGGENAKPISLSEFDSEDEINTYL